MDDAKLFKSLLFREWNKAFGAAKRGQLSNARVRKALQIIQSGKSAEKFYAYGTTKYGCHCPDSIDRGEFCKHRIAFIIINRIYEKLQEILVNELFKPLKGE
ncbi:MAG TPA: hypothetical protein VFF49_06615 [Thermodesulfobacteriota bacterium]|nr:hypothetical protein [Thermodesulfobacteriota bacterium]